MRRTFAIYSIITKSDAHGTFTCRFLMSEVVGITTKPASGKRTVSIILRGAPQLLSVDMAEDELTALLVAWEKANPSARRSEGWG
jgi:hypothetical protein